MSSSKQKLLRLMDIFYSATDEEHRLNAQELASMLSDSGLIAERKAIYRDIGVLQDFGMDIVQTPTGYYLKKRSFSLAELRTMMSAICAASFVTTEKTDELCKKLASLASIHQAADYLPIPVIGGVKCANEEVFKTIEIINKAIQQNRTISFLYYKLDSTLKLVKQRMGKRYVVSPYALIWMQDRYYLVCSMTDRDDLTHFRLDRIRSVRTEQQLWRHFNQVSDYRKEFDVADYAAKCINMFGGKPEQIILQCKYDYINEVVDRFGADIGILSRDAKTFIMQTQAVAEGGLISWICQFGDGIEVIRPQELREKVKARLTAGAKLYE